MILDDGLLERAGRGEADSEVEHDDAVVAIDIGDGVAIDAASSDGLTLPDERQIIVADGRVDFGNRVYPYLDGVLLCAGGERGEMDVVDTEVVAGPPCILVENGDGGRTVVSTVPHLVDFHPSSHFGNIEDVSQLGTVDAELKLCHVSEVPGDCGPWRQIANP